MPNRFRNSAKPATALAEPPGQDGVLELDALLAGLDRRSRRTFLDLLALEGFEITIGIPNLHLPEELDAALGSLEDLGRPGGLRRIHGILSRAAVYGTLVDLSLPAAP